MSPQNQLVEGAVGTALYTEVQQFYSRQMRLLDDGLVDGWADTFTAGGVFSANARPEPTVGRDAIAAAARTAQAALAEQGVQHRHWMGMPDVQQQPDGSIRVLSYALVIATPRDGQARVQLSCTCDDVIVREQGRLLVQERRVSRDDLLGR